jgi:hypothetical protein
VAYRSLGCLVLGVLATGVCVQVLRRSKVNYIYIFEVDPRNKMNEFHFYKISSALLALLSLALLCELLSAKGYLLSAPASSAHWPTLFLLSLLAFLLLNPLHFWFRTFRFELLGALRNTVLAPFCPVRFKDFFLGDVLTSLTKPLSDSLFLVCFFAQTRSVECRPSSGALLAVSLLPFHFRLWQCVYKYRETGLWFPNLVNAGKYLASMGTPLL